MQRRLLENVKHEHHGSDEQDKKLHRDLGYGGKEQAQLAFRYRFAGQITLHLGLVASKIGERQKHPADQAAPQVIAVVPIEVKIDGVELSGHTGQAHRIQERDLARQHGERW